MLNNRSSQIQNAIQTSDNTTLFHTLLEISDEAIFILDSSDFTIVDCNKAALKLFEVNSKSQVVDLSPFHLYNTRPLGYSVERIKGEMATNGQYSQEMLFKTFKQNVFWGKLSQKSIGLSDLNYTVLKITKSANYLKNDEWLSEILKSTSRTIGRQYFKQVTKLLCQTFNARCCFIARRISGDENRLKIFYYHGETLRTSFIDIKNSFVENIMRGYTSYYPQGLKELFPNDKMINETSANSFIGAPLFDSSGKPFGLIGVVSSDEMEEIPNSRYMLSILSSRTAAEIQRIRSKEMLRQQTKELAEINLMKDRLLNVISNDLQAPLNTILGYSTMIRNKIGVYKPEDFAEKMKAMDDSLRNLYGLMENISDWSRLQQGVVKSTPKKNNVASIMEDIRPYLLFLGRLKSINIINKFPSVLNIYGDSYLSRQVIKNIAAYVLKNSAKESKVLFDARLTDGRWKFFVCSENHTADLNEIDFVLNSSLQEFYMSTAGISIPSGGLFIAREFMRLQEGRLSANISEKRIEFIIEFVKG